MHTTSHHLIIRPSEEGHAAVLRLTGDIDLKTAPHLRDRVLEAAQSHDTVVVDLEDVHFIDSPGLGITLHCHRRLAERGAVLVLRNPRREFASLLDIARVDSHVTVEHA